LNKKINVLKKLDSIIGPFAITFVKTLLRPRIKPCAPPSSFLFIRPGGIGDAVLLIPAIKEIKSAYPKARIDLLCEKRNHEIFELCSEIDSVLLYDSYKGLISALRGRYDVVIDSEQSYILSAVVAYLTRAPIRIGFATNDRKKLFSTPTSYKEDEHEMYSFFRLVSALVPDPAFKEGTAFISIPSELSNRIEPHIGEAYGKKLVAIFPGGSTPEKRWPPKRFREVAEKLTDAGYAIATVGGKADGNIGDEITRGLSPAVNLCGSLSLPETTALLNRAALLITGDSGILHIAFAVGTATLSLFGPGNEIKWAPRGDIHQALSSNIDCRPCTKFGNIPPCRRSIECMLLIDSSKVFKKAIKLIER
jgi:lipopolysaccharide heptosyltransferase II